MINPNRTFLHKDSFAKTALILFAIVPFIAFGLTGCGKSNAEKAAEQAATQQAAERHDARQKIKEAIATVKVRAQGSTYTEFRQAELDLKTSYEVNKAYLDDLRYPFSDLVATMQATDECWSFHISMPEQRVYPKFAWSAKAWESLLFLSPEMSAKADLTEDQIRENPDFNPMKYVRIGLTKISVQSDALLKSVEANK